jgi:hypothetical protein
VVTGALLAGLLVATGAGGAPAPAPQMPLPIAPGHEAPLPIAVRTPHDLAFKTEVERQYLIVNLMAGGRIGYEAGDFARAVRDWEALFKIPNLPPEITRVVAPLLADAHRQHGSAAAPAAPPAAPVAEPPAPTIAPPPPEAPPAAVVSGTVTGGGTIGPGGAVIWLKRLDGPTPLPRRGRQRLINQLGKTFVPHVLAIGVGDSVSFRNDDPYFHNVFSLSAGQGFDAGLYTAGRSFVKTFARPGPVELLCNIHASMIGYIYVVDSAYYTQPRPSGAFTIRNVPPGRYELSAWHESTASIVKQHITVGPSGARGIVVRIASDRTPMVVVPDKYGKPRQPQLGY